MKLVVYYIMFFLFLGQEAETAIRVASLEREYLCNNIFLLDE